MPKHFRIWQGTLPGGAFSVWPVRAFPNFPASALDSQQGPHRAAPPLATARARQTTRRARLPGLSKAGCPAGVSLGGRVAGEGTPVGWVPAPP